MYTVDDFQSSQLFVPLCITVRSTKEDAVKRQRAKGSGSHDGDRSAIGDVQTKKKAVFECEGVQFHYT